MSEHVYIVL